MVARTFFDAVDKLARKLIAKIYCNHLINQLDQL